MKHIDKAILALFALIAANAATADDAYIQSDGTSYVDTGYKVKSSTKLEVDFEITSTNGVGDGSTAVLFGSESSSGTSCRIWTKLSGSENIFEAKIYGWGGRLFKYGKQEKNENTLWPEEGERYRALLDISKTPSETSATNVWLYGHGESTPLAIKQPKSGFGYNGDSTENLYLFACNPGNGGSPAKCSARYRIYSFRAWEGDRLVLDLIPAVCDGKAGFYDLVNNEFRSAPKNGAMSYGGTPYALPHKLKVFGEAAAADVGDYSQSGLVLHLDGMRNAGAAADHDASASTWIDLSGFGADATLCHGTPADGSAWEADGYNFVSNTYGRLVKSLPLTSNVTIQVACYIEDTTKVNVAYPELISCGGNTSYDYCQVYRFADDGIPRLRFKCSSTTNTTDACVIRMDVNPWRGRYVTAIRDGSRFRLSENATSWSEKTNIKIDSIPANSPWCIAGKIGSDDQVRDNSLLAGKIKSVRVYDRALSDGELVRNRIVDDVRFETGDITTQGMLIVTSNVAVANSAYPDFAPGIYVDASNCTFSVGTSVQTVGGVQYQACGYSVELWDAANNKWGAPEMHYNTSWTCEGTTATPSIRLTWKWFKVHSSYEESGLVVNYDGIWNQGRGKAHSYTALDWINCANPGAYDMSRRSYEGTSWNANDHKGSWADNGFVFDKESTFVTLSSFTIPKTYTIQTLVDATAADQAGIGYIMCDRYTSTSFNWAYCSVGIRSSEFSYSSGKASNTFYLVSGSIGRRPAMRGDSFTYATAIQNVNDGVMFAGTEPPWSAPNTDVSGHACNPSNPGAAYTYANGFCLGGHPSREDETLKGTLKYYRFYNRVLGQEELDRNRVIDDMRYFGKVPDKYALEVRTDVDGVPCPSSQTGVHLAPDGATFTAPGRTSVDGDVYVAHGYTIEHWDGSGWVFDSAVDGALSWTCSGASSATKRLTWRMRKLIAGYVTDGLVLHFDGILNQGAGLPHSDNTDTWVNLGSSGVNAVLVGAGESGGSPNPAPTGATRGSWQDDGYAFTTWSRFFVKPFAFSSNHTTQIAMELPANMTATNEAFFFSGKYAYFALKLKTETQKLYFNTQGSSLGPVLENIAPADLKHATAIQNLDEGYAALSTGASAPVPGQDGYQSFASMSGDYGIASMCFGGYGGNHTENMDGTVKSFRYYNRVLTDPELAANRVTDEIRLFARRDSMGSGKGWVVIKSNVPGVEGFERSGAYYLGPTNYVFSAPTNVTVDGIEYMLTGCIVSYGNVTEDCDDFNWERGSELADKNCELTWEWKIVNGFDTTGGALTDYVHPESLAIHLDGIKNAGADKPHDPNATKWVNVAAGAASIKGETRFVNSMPIAGDPWTNSLASAWFGDRYYFNGHRYTVLDQNLDHDLAIGRKVVVEVVCDVDTALLRSRWNAQNDSLGWGVSVWPYLVGTTTAPSPLQLFYHAADDRTKGDYDMLRFKVNNQNFVTNATYNAYAYPDGIPDGMEAFVGIKGWGGKYAVGLHNYHNNGASNDGTIFEGEKPNDGWWFGPGLTNDVGTMNVTVGGGNSSNGGYSRSLLVGNIRAVRIYNNEFTGGNPDCIANRKVDDIRFHRAAPGETNVTVVARYDNATSYGSGYYNVIGKVNFEAWDAMSRRGATRRLKGCYVETKPYDETEWVTLEWRENTSADSDHRMTVAYNAGQGTGSAPQTDTADRMRITWVWEGKGMRMLFK